MIKITSDFEARIINNVVQPVANDENYTAGNIPIEKGPRLSPRHQKCNHLGNGKLKDILLLSRFLLSASVEQRFSEILDRIELGFDEALQININVARFLIILIV